MLQRFVDPAAVAAEIERGRSLCGHPLRGRWQSVFGAWLLNTSRPTCCGA
jgi:hypothetical protein